MKQLKVYAMPVGEIGANCYFCVNEQTNEVFCVDTGAQGDKICQFIKENGWTLRGIFLTHGHADHIGAIPYIKTQMDVEVYAGKEEVEVLEKPELNLTTMFGETLRLQADHVLEDGEEVNVAGFVITAIATPGHTKGGVCYAIKEEGVVFTGDTLFRQSIGRTDFPTGNFAILEASIKQKLYTLEEDTVVYPGHDAKTSIAYEKQHNMFVRGN